MQEMKEIQFQSLGQEDPQEEGSPLQYSCPESLMDRRAWWAIVHTVAKQQSTHAQKIIKNAYPNLKERNGNM